jgi:hypothetical protein
LSLSLTLCIWMTALSSTSLKSFAIFAKSILNVNPTIWDCSSRTKDRYERTYGLYRTVLSVRGHILWCLFHFLLHFRIRLVLFISNVEDLVVGFFPLSTRGEVRCYSLRKRVFSSGVMGCGHARRGLKPPGTEESTISSRRVLPFQATTAFSTLCLYKTYITLPDVIYRADNWLQTSYSW